MIDGIQGLAAAAVPAGSAGDGGGLLQNPMLGGVLIAGGVILAVFLMMRQFVRTVGRPTDLDRDPTERLRDLRDEALRRREPIEQLMADSEELTRRLAAAMDMKAARMEKLLGEAEATIRRLEAAAGRVPGLDAVADAGAGLDLDSTAEPEHTRVAGRIDPAILDRARLDQLGRERSGGGGDAEALAGRSGLREPLRAASPQTPTPSLHERVFAMADEGRAAMEIARAVNQPVGQVELILNLRPR